MKTRQQSILYWSLELLILALLVWVCSKLDFVFRPVIIFISVTFVPLVVSLFLYYMLNPVVKLLIKLKLGKFHLPRSIASLLVVLLLILLVVGAFMALIPSLVNELTQLIKWLPTATKDTQAWIVQLSHHPMLERVDLKGLYNQYSSQVAKYAQALLASLSSSAGTLIGAVTKAVVITVTVPVMLFYMLKDGNRLVPSVQRFFSQRHGEEVANLLHQMNATLSAYISGQAIECLFVALATSIGYFIIGQPLAIILGLIAGITNMIPYIGPYIGIAPALLVALTVAPEKIIWVIVVVIVVQQIDGNIIYPNIIGKTLNIHPLTIIILLLAAGNIAGITGMILCVPFYAVVKTIINYIWTILKLEQKNKDMSESNDQKG